LHAIFIEACVRIHASAPSTPAERRWAISSGGVNE
jgi:hypothetical protein